MSKKAEKTLKFLLHRIAPKDKKSGKTQLPHGEIAKLAKAADVVPETIRRVHERENMSATTLIDLLLARGANQEYLETIPFTEPTKISLYLSDWNDLGVKLTDTQRKEFLKLIEYLRDEWSLKK